MSARTVDHVILAAQYSICATTRFPYSKTINKRQPDAVSNTIGTIHYTGDNTLYCATWLVSGML